MKGKKVTQKTISSKLTTLPEILKANGYSTFGVASNPHLSETFGFARGFDYFKQCFFNLSDRAAPAVNQIIYSWKDQLEMIKKLQTDWSDNSVSCTVYYKKEDLDDIKKYLNSSCYLMSETRFFCVILPKRLETQPILRLILEKPGFFPL